MKKYFRCISGAGVAIIAFMFLPTTHAFAAEPTVAVPADITTQATGPDGANVTFSVTAADTDASSLAPSCTPASGSLFALGTTTVICAATSTINSASTTAAHFYVGVLPLDTVTISLRDNGVLVGPFTVTLPSATAPAVPITATGDSASHDVPARSVLAALTTLDATTTSFDITNLQYFPSFSSFIVNCISVPSANSAPDCYNWTYAVNGSFPQVGMDATTLQNGDALYVIFGSQWQVSTDKPSVATNESFTVTAEEYDPSSGLYAPAAGEVVGAVQFDSNFVATEFATSTTDGSGHATLSLPNAGDYSVGIASTGYFSNTPITVSTSTPPTPIASGGGGSSASHSQLNVSSALAYLASKQNSDGSFAADFLTDWAAFAFAAQDSSGAKAKLVAYERSAAPALSSVTDYERHAMALEALGINPYTGTATNYIAPIVNAFDGIQIGDASLDNDDIFALFPLLRAGYSASDNIIQKTTAFILSAQNTSGSWDESVDMTAAAMQALSQVSSAPEVQAAITKAENYLHTQQQSDGGFRNSFATSWAIQAIAALGESAGSWAPYTFTPQDYLAGLQQSDGGVDPVTSSAQTRIWATEYAIPAALGKPWGSLLQSFPLPDRPKLETTSSTSEAATQATSTQPIPARRAKPKIKIPITSVSPTLQLAAVATAPTDNFFTHLWGAIVSFFIKLL